MPAGLWPAGNGEETLGRGSLSVDDFVYRINRCVDQKA